MPLRRRPPLSRWLLAGLLVPGLLGAAPLPDDAVKAAVIYKVMLFTHWPATATAAPLTLCVLGRDEVADALPDLQGRRVGSRALNVRSAGGREPLRGCDAAYLAAAERHWLETLDARPGLMTVVDCGAGLCRSGAVLSLAVEEGRLVFAVDRPRAERQGLEFSAQVLRLARPLPP